MTATLIPFPGVPGLDADQESDADLEAAARALAEQAQRMREAAAKAESAPDIDPTMFWPAGAQIFL